MFKVLLLIVLELSNDNPDLSDKGFIAPPFEFKGWSVLKGVSLFKFDFKV